MVHLHRAHLHLGEQPENPVGRLRRRVPDFEGELPLDDGAGGVGADVEGLDGHGAVGILVGEEGLGPAHAGAGGVDGPGDPAIGFGRRRDEGDGEGGVGGVVGPVEVGAEGGEVGALGVELVVGERLGGAGQGMRR